MIKAVIIEDEKYAVLNLQNLLQEYAPGVRIVSVFESGREALQNLPGLEFDLLFLDIQFNDDFDAFEMLNAWQFEQLHIIFVTSYNQYAIQAFKYNAIDYVTKPIDKDNLLKAINKARTRIFKKKELDDLITTIQAFRNKQIAIKSQSVTFFIPAKNILYIKAEKEYSIVCYFEEEREKLNKNFAIKNIINSKHLGFWENELTTFPFLRIHKSFLVNMDQIQSFGSKQVKLISGEQLEIARDRRKEVHLKILTYKTE